MALFKGSKNIGPNSSNIDRVRAVDPRDDPRNRDVFELQQLDRSKREKVRSATASKVVAVIAGVMTALVLWIGLSVVGYTVNAAVNMTSGPPSYITTSSGMRDGEYKTCYFPADKDGNKVDDTCFESEEDVPEPDWHKALVAEEAKKNEPTSLGDFIFQVSLLKAFVSLVGGLIVWSVVRVKLLRTLQTQNAMRDHTDINQHEDDARLLLPEEVMEKFAPVPDVGAHFSEAPSSLVSHVMLSNKGIKSIDVAKRYGKDILDEDGDVETYKGEVVYNDEGEIVTYNTPFFDKDFGNALFDASDMKIKEHRIFYDARKIDYNRGNRDREKLSGYNTWADVINGDWEFPLYEVQRPAGAYIVDSAPVNTMVIAITRGGKGQTYIEPMIDIWTREKRQHNMVINDPKGELLVKNYVRATQRGYQVVQFNLINPMKTDIYNPLGTAAEAAREGNAIKCAMYVENIANVFFPLDGGEDPVWPNAANNAFKRAAYGLIAVYLEEERELRRHAVATNMAPEVLETKLDEMWGKVTLFNCYQFFVQTSSKKSINPHTALEARREEMSEEEYEAELEKINDRLFLWEDKPEVDQLSLFFTAMEALPKNSIRGLVLDAHNSLKSMAGAEKMLASVYGIAITAMSFFTDPTISTLTSGTPSQNTDLAALAFPRRIGVRLAQNFTARDHLIGSQVKWSAYKDENFTEKYGKEFEHVDTIQRDGWARYFFDGKFPKQDAWLKLEIMNATTGMLIREMFFHFKKGHQVSLDGRRYVKDPVLGEKMVKDGILTELVRHGDKYVPGVTTFPSVALTNVGEGEPSKTSVNAPVITSTSVNYSEKPKAVFLVTPPHLTKYAKLLLILIKQLVDLNFEQSYMTKENQKPLYKTRFMLDELGNLQSEGHGISGFETMLSIGLGQEQQFTLILQTLQQLKDVYGDSVDRVVSGNAQPLDAKIATPTGWIEMGDAEVNQLVLTPSGRVSHITGVYPRGERPVYRVTRADGSSTEACNEHLWDIIVDD